MEVADLVVFYVDYEMSPGMRDAREYAVDLEVPVELRRIGRNDP